MESVMNFLAANYMWFFVAAGILCFALIGFIFDSKKKKNNEFKGESVEETKTETLAESSVNEPVQSESAPIEMMEGPVYEAPVEEAAVTSAVENTMEINDIPMNSTVEEPTFTETPVNPDLETVEPAIEEESPKMSFGESISYEAPAAPDPFETPTLDTTETLDTQEKNDDFTTFDSLN